ncbi:MAG: beta-ketoacyl-[acyl-carrier-protein] synthase II, partial [Bryobacteraceae bacterium]|nr:beta-ketoacyl-[acyl-carrier-protein] synthase II [Bryobacteraceae bacterium]
MARRVVVTGVGLVSSLGIGTEENWTALRAGQSGVGRIEAFDISKFACKIAGEVRGFDPADYIERKEIKKMARFMHFAI